MTNKKNKSSVSKAIKKDSKGRVIDVLYLSNKDEEMGLDIKLNMVGYEITVL